MAGAKKIGAAKQGCPLKGIPLLVTVKEASGLSVAGFTVSVLDAAMPPKVTARGVVDPKGRASLKSLPPGDFEIRALPPDSVRPFFDDPLVEVTLPERSNGEVCEIEVTAKRKKVGATLGALSAQVWVMPGAATRAAPFVEVTFSDDDPELPFRGKARLSRTEHVDVFFDAECTAPLTFDRSNEADIPQGFLTQQPSLRLYLRGRKQGAARLSLRVVPVAEHLPFVEPEAAAGLDFDVKEANVVRGLVAAQLPAILVDPGLSARLPQGEAAIVTMPTKVQLRVDQSGQDVPFEGGATFHSSNPHVAFFTDEALTTPFPLDARGEATLTHDDIADGKVITLWARASAAGMVALSLKPSPVEQPGLWIEEQGPVELGMVKAACEVMRWEDGVNPREVPLSADELARRGRFLHVQDGKANHGRARLRLKKLDPRQWPESAKELTWVVSVSGASGAVNLFAADKGGKPLRMPFAVSRADLLSDDVSLWIEGAEDSLAARSLALDVGVAREKAPEAPLLSNAFWTKLTVVTLAEVKPASELAAPTPEYKKGALRHVINLALDPTGRRLDVAAKLKKAIDVVPVGFVLVADEKNRKKQNNGVEVPRTWTFDASIEKKDRNAGVCFSAKTDATGLATLTNSLQVSRVAGDRFRIAAFVLDDVPLGHWGTSKGYTRKPLVSEPIQVWTKLWYQLTHNDATKVPEPSLAVKAYEQVRSELVASSRKRFKKADAPANTYYPRWMLRPKKGDDEVAVIGGHNKDVFMAMLDDDPNEPRKAHVVVCDEQWDPGAPSGVLTVTVPAGLSRFRVALPQNVLKPPLNGGPLVTRSLWFQGVTQKQAITDDWVEIPKDRASTSEIEIVLPVGVASSAGNEITVHFEVETALGPYLGESDGVNILAVYNPKEVADFSDTIAHEIGHSLNQTPRNGAQPLNAPDHPQQVDHGQGNHCTDRACVMYESGPQSVASHRFCDVCRPYLIAEDFSKWS